MPAASASWVFGFGCNHTMPQCKHEAPSFLHDSTWVMYILYYDSVISRQLIDQAVLCCCVQRTAPKLQQTPSWTRRVWLSSSFWPSTTHIYGMRYAFTNNRRKVKTCENACASMGACWVYTSAKCRDAWFPNYLPRALHRLDWVSSLLLLFIRFINIVFILDFIVRAFCWAPGNTMEILLRVAPPTPCFCCSCFGCSILVDPHVCSPNAPLRMLVHVIWFLTEQVILKSTMTFVYMLFTKPIITETTITVTIAIVVPFTWQSLVLLQLQYQALMIHTEALLVTVYVVYVSQ